MVWMENRSMNSNEKSFTSYGGRFGLIFTQMVARTGTSAPPGSLTRRSWRRSLNETRTPGCALFASSRTIIQP